MGIVYDITDKETFDNVRQWIFEIDRYAADDVSILLIGNKSDLSNKREVSYDAAKSFAEELDIEYIETSAKESYNIDMAFHRMSIIIKSKYLAKNINADNCNVSNSWNDRYTTDLHS